jgi:hypothetical protein
MRQRIITIGLTSLAFVLAIAACPGVARGQEIDPNKQAFMGTWSLTMTPTDITVTEGAKVFSEKLYFENDDIMAEAFAQYGFVSEGFWTFAEGPMFYGMMSSNSKGSLYWQGVAVDGRLSGYVIWTKNDGAVWMFTLAGPKVN